MVYLNHAGSSWPKPAAVHTAVAETLSADPDSWPERFERGRAEVAQALGIADPERLLLTPGCTAALATALGDLGWERDDRLVTSALEHHALSRWGVKLARERGVRHLASPWRPGEPFDLEWLEEQLRAGGVRLVALTMASNVTGELLPVREAAELARRYGVSCLVDAAQTAGALPLDVAEIGADMLAFAGHKGPQGPQGIGGLYLAPGAALACPSASCELPAAADRSPLASEPSYCDVGSLNLAGLAGLAAGFGWLQELGQAWLRERAIALGERLLDALEALPGVRILGGREPARRIAAVSVTVAGHTPAELEAGLAERGVIARGGLHCAPLAHETLGSAEHGTLRLSLGPTSSAEDVDTALAALGELLS